MLNFTFQSGYIQMPWTVILSLSIEQPLHSNLVIFKCRFDSNSFKKSYPLHSNLVIFKCSLSLALLCLLQLYIPIWLYSNAVRIFKSIIFKTLHSNLVIFKWKIFNVGNPWKILYIPIWLYSNHATICDYSVIFIFTFQSGYIQIFFFK